MSVVTDIASTLGAWPGLAGIAARPDRAEQDDAAPYIVFQKVAGTRTKSLNGDSGLANPIYQFDVYATTRIDADSLCAEVGKAIQANIVLGAVHAGEGSGYESETKLFRARVDFSLWYYD